MKAFRPYPLCFLLFCVVLQALNEYKAMEPSNTELILIRITGEDRPGPFLSGEERRICGLGEHAGQEPLYPDFVGTQTVGFANTGRHFGVGRTGAEHRCHQASHRAHSIG